MTQSVPGTSVQSEFRLYRELHRQFLDKRVTAISFLIPGYVFVFQMGVSLTKPFWVTSSIEMPDWQRWGRGGPGIFVRSAQFMWKRADVWRLACATQPFGTTLTGWGLMPTIPFTSPDFPTVRRRVVSRRLRLYKAKPLTFRFVNGQWQVLGGWRSLTTSTLTGVCRGVSRGTVTIAISIAFGTHSALQVCGKVGCCTVTPTLNYPQGRRWG